MAHLKISHHGARVVFQAPTSLRVIPRHYGVSAPAQVDTEPSDHSGFFNYTSGRWIHDEQRQLASRYLKFDIEELKKVAVDAGGASSVTKLEKIAEDSLNKVFSIVLDNERQMVARLPGPRCTPARLSVASEVATMDYVRSRADLPVPRVLAWCCDRDSTPVGAEYIITEQAPGVTLRSVWQTLPQAQKLSALEELVKMQRSMASRAFEATGSIFYRGDVDDALRRKVYTNIGEVDADFVVGPSMEQRFWYRGRASLDIDRGPWTRPEDYITAPVRRELCWIDQMGTNDPRANLINFAYSQEHLKTAFEHKALLKQYLTIAPHLIPLSNPSILVPTLWRQNLTLDDIFLSKEALEDGETAITSITNWQHTSIGPFYLQAQAPEFAHYPGNPSEAKLPENVEMLTEQQLAVAKSEVELAELHLAYEALSADFIPGCRAASELLTRSLALNLFNLSGTTWEGYYSKLRQQILELTDIWTLLFPGSIISPVNFTPDERESIKIDSAQWNQSRDIMGFVNYTLGTKEDGWIPAEGFDQAVAANIGMRENVVQSMSGEGGADADTIRDAWPYKGSV